MKSEPIPLLVAEMTDLEQYEAWMRRAIEVGMRGWGRTHPNPAVGALIIEDGEIVAEGFHPKVGELHAERQALKALGRRPKPEATMVVTMEPCSTHGRTPPCVDGIIEAGISRVIVGTLDPNPKHAGKGLTILRDAGIEVVPDVLASTCNGMNPLLNHRMVHKNETMFAVKIATTLDGKIATRTGHSRWITGEIARANVMEWRFYFPAILVGSGTVLADDPSLTIRRLGEPETCSQRIVIDIKAELNQAADARLLNDSFVDRTIVLSTDAWAEDSGYLSAFREKGGAVVAVKTDAQGHVEWATLKQTLGNMGVSGVMIEPGSGLMRSLMRHGAIDYLIQYIAPKVIGDAQAYPAFDGLGPNTMDDALFLEDPVVEQFGEDTCIRGAWSTVACLKK